MSNKRTTVRSLVRAGAVLAPALLLAAVASAQTPQPDARWQAWIGCWAPAEAEAQALHAADAATPPTVCVIPAGAGVEVATVVDGEVVQRDRLHATGERRASEREGCTGWESLTWSADGRRLYRQTEHQCEGGLTREASGLLAILPGGEWLDVQGVSAGGETGVRVQRYRSANRPPVIEAELAQALEGRGFALDAARLAAAARITEAEVVDAVRHLDPAVVEGWLIEQGQGFGLDARRLVALADAGVPERVIDLMVALSYPRVFALDRGAREGEFRPTEQTGRDGVYRPGPVVMMDPWYDSGFGRGYYPGYGYSGYGYNGFGYRWYSGAPTVIVVREPEEERPRGRVVNGRGYTRGGDGGNARGRSTSSAGSGSDWSRVGAGSGSSGSGDTAGSGSSSSGSSTGRTARPRGSGGS